MEEHPLLESVSQLLAQAPAPVRSFVLNELPATTERLMQRHSLHVDHAGVLEAELFLLLVGQSTPAELVKGLTDAGIDQEKVRAIVEDVNTEVFIRLRTEEQKAPSIPTPTLTPTAPATQKVIPI